MIISSCCNNFIFYNIINKLYVEKMKKILLLIMLIFAFGCSDDTTSSSENSIIGKWKANVTPKGIFEQSYLILQFTVDGNFTKTNEPEWLEISNIKGTYSISNKTITVISEECGEVIGNYEFEFRDNGVEFILVDEECEEREYLVDFFENY